MKITIEKDDKSKEVFDNVTDAYIAVRQLKPMISEDNKNTAFLPETRSYSWGDNVRELVKEIQQSIIELQDILKNLINKK